MVLGAIPLALAHGAGAESRQAIGWVIVGGLVFGTFLTLFVIPTIYTVVMRTVHLADSEVPAVPLTAGGGGPITAPHREL
jgi:multidrug efflux pump